jgi:signal transduction histidine kinase
MPKESQTGRSVAGAGWPDDASELSGSGTHVRVLDEICHAFASADDLGEACAGTTRWVREALNDDGATVRIALPDGDGRLRLAHTDGTSRMALRTALAKREEVFRSKRPDLIVLAPSRNAVVRMPLVTRGEPVGVLEVVTDGDIRQAMPTLRAVSSQAAIAFGNLRNRARLSREIAIRGSLAALSQLLLRAPSSEAALDSVAKFCAEHLSLPVAAWTYGGDDRGMRLATARGVDRDSAEALETSMAWIPRWDTLPSNERASVRAKFATLTGSGELSEVAVAGVLLLAGGTRAGLLAVAEDLLEETLGHLETVHQARRRSEQLDLALAWTAHEFRSPLLGVKAMLEQILEPDQDAQANQDKLRDLHSELEELSELVEPVLQWSAGAVPLRRQDADIVALVREAVESTWTDERPIGISGVDGVMAPVDANHLRTAISNLIRNAMAYSPQGTTVEASIHADREVVTISVADRGPGVPPSDRESIFDPFMRGNVGQSTRFGKGLGLFIARRVVEAHGGRIWVESPGGQGAVFHLAIPRNIEATEEDGRRIEDRGPGEMGMN